MSASEQLTVAAPAAFLSLPPTAPSGYLRSRGGAAQRVEPPDQVPENGFHSGRYTLPCAIAGAVAALGVSCAARWRSRRCRATSSTCQPRATKVTRQAGFGPDSYEMRQRKDAVKDSVGSRINYLIEENAKGISTQMDQYGFAQIDGFMGGSMFGTPDNMREEMRTLFGRGWFEQESETESAFKVGHWKITNQDTEHRFRARMKGYTGSESDEKVVETQAELAPTIVEFSRGLLVSLARHIGKATGYRLSSQIGITEMFCLAGNGARYDRRVNNVYGWETERGFAPDTRKLSVFYFVNPLWEEQFGGHLQLEGVKTPTGGVSIAPAHDRLVMFWSDRSVWSMRPVQAPSMNEFQFGIQMTLVVEDQKQINYDPKRFQQWFPELQSVQMDWAPPMENA